MKVMMLIVVMVIVGGCAKPQPTRLSPPSAYLQLPPPPIVPENTATNLDLANYLYKLHDDSKQCRQQINNIKKWVGSDD